MLNFFKILILIIFMPICSLANNLADSELLDDALSSNFPATEQAPELPEEEEKAQLDPNEESSENIELPKKLITNIPVSASNYKNTAKLQCINKITTEISYLNIKLNESKKCGNLSILVKSCWQAPSDQSPENKILMLITEKKPNDPKKYEIFHGWMFSSSPSISSLSHPVYDIVAISCIG